MLKIRLARVGRKNDPSYRVIVTESTQGPKSGKYIEMLGSYNPKLSAHTLNGERIKHWIGNGAQVSDTVHNLLVNEKIIEGKKINVLPRKSPIKKDLPAQAGGGEVPAAEETTPVAETEAPAEAAPEAPAEDTPTEVLAEAAAEVAAPAETGPALEEEKRA